MRDSRAKARHSSRTGQREQMVLARRSNATLETKKISGSRSRQRALSSQGTAVTAYGGDLCHPIDRCNQIPPSKVQLVRSVSRPSPAWSWLDRVEDDSGGAATVSLPEPSTDMQTAVRPPRQQAFQPREPITRMGSVGLRLLLIVVVIGATAVLVATLFIPAVAGANKVMEVVDTELLGQASVDDIQFPRFPERSRIYASDNTLLTTIYLGENRKYVKLQNVSQAARDAVLAIEDARFYEHGGVDVEAVIRAMFANLAQGEIIQGGSTLTMQLVKLQFTDSAETLSRKVREASMALALEQEYTKDQIFELYLNKIYFANSVYGIGTASQFYFGKPAGDLNVAEGAALAGMLRAPEFFNPLTNPESVVERRDIVIEHMQALGWITPEVADQALTTPLELRQNVGQPPGEKEPYFVSYIKEQILDVRGHPEFDALGTTYDQRKETLFQGGLRIYTTLDPQWQQLAELAVRGQLPLPNDPQAAVATLETRTGAVRTLLSGADFLEDELELAAGTGRQTGSAAKPFTLVAAFRQGIPPGKVYRDESPIEIEGWRSPCGCVYNAEGAGDDGWRDLWDATQYSINVIFAQLAMDVGPENIVKAARDMGITTPLDAVPAITLGSEEATPLDMAAAYATLANDGVRCETFAVQRIESREGLVYKHRPGPNCQQVIAPEIAHQVTAMLERATCCGTGSAAVIGRPQAGKTGTQVDNTNAWYVGYIRQLSTAVWVGYARGLIPMTNVHGEGPVFGGDFPARIWHDFMVRIVDPFPVEDFPDPPPPQFGDVPGVIGLLQGDAEITLAEANFTPIAQTVRGAEPAGTVIGQSPGAGARIELGAAVHIQVSDGQGPPKRRVPLVVGFTLDQAIITLQQQGFVVDMFQVEVPDPALHGIVLDQVPAGGKAKEGSTVAITVGVFRDRPPGAPTPTPPPPDG
jgi:penicillin-binding protein 1A